MFDRLSVCTIVGERLRVMGSYCLEVDVRFLFAVVTTNTLVSGATGRMLSSSFRPIH